MSGCVSTFLDRLGERAELKLKFWQHVYSRQCFLQNVNVIVIKIVRLDIFYVLDSTVLFSVSLLMENKLK